MIEIEQLIEEFYPSGLPPSPTLEARLTVAAALETELLSENEPVESDHSPAD